MRNFIYISLLSLGLIATSCSKDEMVLTNADRDIVPAWDDTSNEMQGRPESESESGDDGVIGQSENGQTDGFSPIDGVSPIDGDITDPNNDPDGKKKKN